MKIPKVSEREFSDAIESGDSDVVVSLLQNYPELVNAPSWTPPPLHCAILWNQPKVAEVLLDHGADLELRDPDRQTTPLRYAVMYGKVDLIPMLVSRGANQGAIEEGGLSALELAETAASGEYEEFEDIPRREEYVAVVELLKKIGH